jgi:hypothetical protein
VKYPPTFAGFLKAVFDTLRGKKLRPRIPKDEPVRDIDDYEIYEPDNGPGMEFWRAEAEKLAERKEQEKADAEKLMIQDFESRHAEEASTETAEFGGEAEERDDSSGTDDFHADVGVEIDEDF